MAGIRHCVRLGYDSESVSLKLLASFTWVFVTWRDWRGASSASSTSFGSASKLAVDPTSGFVVEEIFVVRQQARQRLVIRRQPRRSLVRIRIRSASRTGRGGRGSVDDVVGGGKGGGGGGGT